MNSSKPAPAFYGSLLNFTSLPQRFAGLLVEDSYVDEEDLDTLGLFPKENYENVYSGIGKILENEGLVEDLDLEDEDYRTAVQKTFLRAGLRKESNEIYGASVQQNNRKSLTDYLVDSGLVSKDEHIDNYTKFFMEEGVISNDYEKHEVRESMANIVTKAMLDSERNVSEADGDYIRPSAKYVWDIMTEEMGVTPVPVQIPGERVYRAEPTTKEGTMLGAVEGEGKITVMAYLGLEEEFYQELVADENKESEIYTVKEAKIEVPAEVEEELEADLEIPEKTRYLLMNLNIHQIDRGLEKEKNQDYHDFILESENLLSEELGEEVGELLIEKYQSETLERPLMPQRPQDLHQLEEVEERLQGLKKSGRRENLVWIRSALRSETARKAIRWSNTLLENNRAEEAFGNLMNNDLLETQEDPN